MNNCHQIRSYDILLSHKTMSNMPYDNTENALFFVILVLLFVVFLHKQLQGNCIFIEEDHSSIRKYIQL